MDTTPFSGCMPWGRQILAIATTLEANHYLGCAREQLPSASSTEDNASHEDRQESMKDEWLLSALGWAPTGISPRQVAAGSWGSCWHSITVTQTWPYPLFLVSQLTPSATFTLYSSLHKSNGPSWGPRLRHGDDLGLWRIRSQRNQGCTMSFNLPFLYLQSETSGPHWHRVTTIHFLNFKASTYNSKGSRGRFC